MRLPVLIFDIETLTDLKSGAHLYGLDLPEADLEQALIKLRRQESGMDFQRLALHEIVCISGLWLDEQGGMKMFSFSREQHSEAEILTKFLSIFDKRHPTLVSWNGSQFDIPVILPKDTWFGPDHRTGEMCYATSVDGRTELNLLRPRAFRAVTPIDFHNVSSHQLRFDRMNVPVPALPLFYSESTGRLWTSQIKVVYEGNDRPARVRIENRTPPLAGEVIYVHPPRSPGGALFNMFDSFF